MSSKPRCLAPMQERAGGEINPVCWRPQHEGGKHQSRASWRTAKLRSARQYRQLLAKRQEWTT